MALWKKLIYSGSNAHLNQVTASFKGDGSEITNISTSSFAHTSSFNTSIFSRAVTYFVSGGMPTAPEAFTIWRTPYPCRIVSLQGWADVSGSSINARKSGSGGFSPHTSSFLMNKNSDWVSSNSVINTDYTTNETLQFTITGSALTTRITIQANFIRI